MRSFQLLRTFLVRVSNGLALLGGGIVVCLAALTVVNILGRWAAGIPFLADSVPWLGSITGYYELVEMGTGIAVFAFLPYCQMNYSHVTVDIFFSVAGPRARAAATLFGNALFTVVSALLAWRMHHGLAEKLRYEETTMMLSLPVWWGFLAGTVLLGLTVVVCIFTTANACAGLFRGVDPNSVANGVRVWEGE